MATATMVIATTTLPPLTLHTMAAMVMAAAHARGLSTFVTSMRETDTLGILRQRPTCCHDCAGRSKPAVGGPTAAGHSADKGRRRLLPTDGTGGCNAAG